MLGGYTHMDNTNKQYWPHTIFLVLHVVISHVFMLNYLIAILATTYEIMEPMGKFAY